MNTSSVAYMKEYLKYAVEFEKYVYIWQRAMNEANNRMRTIYDQRSRIESTQNSTQNSLEGLDARYDSQQKYNEREAMRYKKKQRTALIILFIILAVYACIGCYLGAELLNDPNKSFVIARAYVIPIIALACVIIGGIFTGVIPICLGIWIFNKNKYKQFSENANQKSSEASRRRQEIILRAKEDAAESYFVENIIEGSVISKRQEEISVSLQKAKKDLTNFYAENVLPAKYRSLNAVATLYEYLETGRCNTIQGHGGIYDTYENDLRLGLIIQNLVEMNNRLADIQANQRLLYQELQQANRTLSGINSSLNNIEKTNEEIAKNTAISAVADQQTAVAARWMAWNSWAKGN